MFLGIDLGTSSVKLVLLNEEQEIIAQHSQPLSVSQPHPLWSEQNPEDWWAATCKGIKVLKETHPKEFKALQAIGLSGQQHGATMVDKFDKVVRPAMLWNDGRSMSQCQTLATKVPHYTNIIGNGLMPGFTAPKVLWVAENEPEAFQKISKIFLPKDFIRLKLTGEYATDLSDASGTGWLNVSERNWSEEMLAAMGLTKNHMPQLFEGSEITGKVTANIASDWNISSNTVVVGGAGDNPAGAISVNVIKPGSAFLSIGTSGVYFVATDSYQSNPADYVHTFCHCLPKQWHHMSVHLSAASCLGWLANTLQTEPSELLKEAEKNPVSNNTVIFLPYLSGERTPHNNPHAKGVFFGISNTTSRSDMTHAVMEGVAFAFADGQDAMLRAGIEIKELSAVGGGAKSLYWGRIFASALQRPIIYRSNREVGAAMGAARLAWLAKNPCDVRTAFKTPSIETIVEPDAELSNNYVRKYETFKKLYRAVEELFPAL